MRKNVLLAIIVVVSSAGFMLSSAESQQPSYPRQPIPAGQSGYAQSGYAQPGQPLTAGQPAQPGYSQPGYSQPGQPLTAGQPAQPGYAQPGYSQPGQPVQTVNPRFAPRQVQPGQVQPGQVQSGQVQPRQPQGNAPFQLTPPQQQAVDQVLTFWERYTQTVRKFESQFDLYTYTAVSAGEASNNQSVVSQGFMKYESPNKGVYRIDEPVKELHRCNGKSIFTYNFDKHEINEYQFAEGGQELNKGPMAFLFGASAATLRQRYWIRLITPQNAPKGQIWLEAFPKFIEDRQDLVKAELIIQVDPIQPVAFQRFSPNGDRQVYHLKGIKVNKLGLFDRELFEPNERDFKLIKSTIQAVN